MTRQGGLPTVSVIIPARDAARALPATLDALLAGDYPPDRLEVVVAVAPPGDQTLAVLARAAARAGARLEAAMASPAPAGRSGGTPATAGGGPVVRAVGNPSRGTSAGLNAALAASTGDVIVRLDAHAVPAPDYVRACVAALEHTGAWAVGGPMVGAGGTPFGAAVSAAQATWLGSGGAAYRSRVLRTPRRADTVYLGAWPRAVLERLGGFDEALGRNQDYELCLRIREAGGEVWLDPAIRTATRTRDTPLALARQYLGYGAGRAATWRRHPRSLRARQAVPAAFVAALGLAAAMRVTSSAASARAKRGRHAGRPDARHADDRGGGFTPRGALDLAMAVPPRRSSLAPATAVLAALSGPYALAVAAVAARHGDRTAAGTLRVGVALAIMHAAWGIGFWAGLARSLAPRRGGR